MEDIMIRMPSHQERDPDFNAKARLYKTATFTDAAHELEPGRLPFSPVRVVYMSEEFNAMYGAVEPVFACYRRMDDSTLIGTYFARALKDFVL